MSARCRPARLLDRSVTFGAVASGRFTLPVGDVTVGDVTVGEKTRSPTWPPIADNGTASRGSSGCPCLAPNAPTPAPVRPCRSHRPGSSFSERPAPPPDIPVKEPVPLGRDSPDTGVPNRVGTVPAAGGTASAGASRVPALAPAAGGNDPLPSTPGN